jgi:hypothetical protein
MKYSLLAIFVLLVSVAHATPLPSPNGWDFLIQAGKVKKGVSPFVKEDEPDRAKRLLTLQREHVAQNAETFRLVEKGLSLDIVRPQQTFSEAFPNNATLRELARSLGDKARIEAADGQWESSANTATDAMQMGVAITRGATLTGALTGAAIEALGLYHLKNAAPHLKGDALQKLIARLEKIVALRPAFADVLEVDKQEDLATLRGTLNHPDWQQFRARKSASKGLKQSFSWDTKTFAALLKISDQQIEENYVRAMDNALTQARKTFVAQEETPAPADALSALIFSSSGTKRRRLPLERYATRTALLLVSLALRAYHEEHGAYPASLQLLGGKYLRQIPRDPFDATRPLAYRLDGKSYVLYSVGPDGADNNGTPIDNPPVDGKPLSDIRRRFTEVTSKGDMVFGINQ